MAFAKRSIEPVGDVAASPVKPDVWTIFRALRDARSAYGLRPGHIQTLQALLSFLKPGQGETVFASNESICLRVGGIDERTLRRHIRRFVELGFITRNDSSNRKRYRLRSSGEECISYGLSLTPLLNRAAEFIDRAQELEQERRDSLFLRKQILSHLAILDEHSPDSTFTSDTRKALRRKLTLTAYRALLAEAVMECQAACLSGDVTKPTKLPANDGQTVRHQSMSEKEDNEIEAVLDDNLPKPETLVSVCDQAAAFASNTLRSWFDIEKHARTLAPMMGIHPAAFEKATHTAGARKAACAIFIMLQIGERISDFSAYFHSITLGKRQTQFDPVKMLRRLSEARAPAAQCPPRWT